MHVNEKLPNLVNREGIETAAEAYEHGRLALHLHLGVRWTQATAESDCLDLCAVFQRRGKGMLGDLGGASKQVFGIKRSVEKFDGGNIELSYTSVEDAVLINVPKEVEVAERCRRVPSLVRLQALEDCLRVIRNERHNRMAWKSLLVPDGRERDLPSDAFIPEPLDRRRAEREEPSGMVKGGSTVVDGVTDTQAEMERKCVLSASEAHDVASAVLIELIGDTKRLRFKDSPNLVVESFQLLERPLELGPGSS